MLLGYFLYFLPFSDIILQKSWLVYLLAGLFILRFIYLKGL